MILGWSPHQTGTGFGEPNRYVFSESVKKKVGDSYEDVKRSPIPELLYGHQDLFMSALNALPHKNRYRVATLSFNAREVDVNDFNKGDEVSRLKIASCIEAFITLSFAGIPKKNRLPIVAGTHTHTGRLEVNIAMPRAVFNSEGHIRSFNPHPPMKGSRDDFDYLIDMLNHEFNWDDPRDPERRRKLKTADWIEKQAAEVARSGAYLGTDCHPFMFLWRRTYAMQGEFATRDDLLRFLTTECKARKLNLTPQENSILISVPDSKHTMTLRGDLVDGTPLSSYLDRVKRQEFLATASQRVAIAWQKRADWNSNRYSRGEWQLPAPDFLRIMQNPKILMSKRHPDHSPTSIKKAPGSRISSYALEMLSRLRGLLIDAFASVTISTAIFNELTPSIRNLANQLEFFNDPHQHNKIKSAGPESGNNTRDDLSPDHFTATAHRGQWKGANGRTNLGTDRRAQRRKQIDGPTGARTGKRRHSGTAPGTDREKLEHIDGEPTRSGVHLKLKRWRAARQAIRELFPDRHAQQIKCYAIVSGAPSAVIIQSPAWRLKFTPDNLEIMRGQIDPDHLGCLKHALASKIGFTGIPMIENHDSPELDDETPEIGW